MIHQTAIVDPSAEIHDTADVGAFSIIGPDVEVGQNTIIGPHVTIKGPTTIGSNNRIYQYCSVGEDPQDKKYSGETASVLNIGDDNVIREYCTINRGTGLGGGMTSIGNTNWIMAYVHIAHDCIIGSRNTFANNATLAGHVTIDNDVILGGFTGIHQFCRIGNYSFTAISSVVVKDVPPFVIVSGNTAKASGLNKEGLKRHGFDQKRINQLRKAYRVLYRNGLLLKDALAELRELARDSKDITSLCDFIDQSQRGITR